jgi:hypothetical protein
VTKQTGGVAPFESTFGFPAPDAREREALGVIRVYLRQAERALRRRALGPAVDSGTAMTTEATLLLTMRESVLGIASFCDGLLEAVDAPAETPDHPLRAGGVGRRS